jgi:hypothetical protein
MKKVLLLILALNLTSSCMQKQQYEVRSPCVSIESANPWAKNPCIRRSVNYDII